MPTDSYTYSTRPYSRPWPIALKGLWEPPFMPLFWIYGAVSLYRAYTTARRRQFELHRRWVIRLNAVFLGVTLSRPVLVLLVVILVGGLRASKVSLGLLTAVWPISGTTLDRKTPIFAGNSSGTSFGRAVSSTPS